MKYSVSSGCSVKVTARSNVHDTTVTWLKVAGSVEVDRDSVEGASARITVDMTDFDAGDWMKNRKIKKDFRMDDHPQAEFELQNLRDVSADGDSVTATVIGVIRWRGREVAISARGTGVVGDSELRTTASFEFDMRELGIKPPRVLMLKIEDVVRVDVTLIARAA